jgi:hypothetical protein
MHTKSEHLSDEELLAFADGELKSSHAAHVNSHLEACWSCRVRRTELEGTIASFVKAQRETLDPMIPPAAGPRALIKMRLAEVARAPRQPRWQFGFSRLGYLTAATAVLVLVVGIWAYQNVAKSKHNLAAEYLAEPDRKLTPGAVRPVSLNEICTGTDDKNRAVSAAIQQQVFRMYGIPNARPQDYEVDYLITPALGGADDIRNLWPEPFADTNWTAHVKDALEDRLHDMVCSGKIDLPTAQQEIANDWIGAYKKYFRTDKPLAEHYAGLQSVNESLIAETFPSE